MPRRIPQNSRAKNLRNEAKIIVTICCTEKIKIAKNYLDKLLAIEGF